MMRWPFKDKRIEWSEEKNRQLIRARGISFQDVVLAIEEEQLVALIPHWNPKKYAKQQALVVILRGYVHVVPCVIDKDKIFLKTIFPSRKIAKRYLLD